MSSDKLYIALDASGKYECSILAPSFKKEFYNEIKRAMMEKPDAELPITINVVEL